MPATFEQLETEKAEITQMILSWSPAQRLFRPAPEVWTALQVVDHLAKTEAKIREDVVANLSAPHALGVRDRLGTMLIQRISSSDRRVKVPLSASAVLPDHEPDLDTLLLGWVESRRRLADLLAHHDPLLNRGGVFRHPVGGWMNLCGVLDFFAVHMRHHRFQLERLQDASRKLSVCATEGALS